MNKISMSFNGRTIEGIDPRINARKANYLRKANKNFDNAASKVVLTIFNINSNKNNDSEDIYEGIKGQIILSKVGKIKRNSYHTVTDNLWAYISDLKPAQVQLLIYIACHLTYNSNVYKADYEQIAKDLNLSAVRVMHMFAELLAIPNQLIIKTNVPKVYLINHNILFKGNYDEFAQIYKELYDDETATLDEKGRVIIK